MTQRLCLITGASAGIGAALAREYASHGWDVALTARRADRLRALQDELEATYEVSALVIPADLADSAAPRIILSAVEAAGRTVDGLINNAGYGLPGGYLSSPWAAHADLIQVMVTAPAELCHRVLPGMKERGFGRVLNIASLAGLLPSGAGHTLYAPVKHFLVRLSESLNAEMEGAGVHVTGLCPGFTYSEFHDVNGTREQVSSSTSKAMWQSAEDVARIGYAACEANAPVRVCGAASKGLATLNKVLPDAAARAIVRAQTAKFRNAD